MNLPVVQQLLLVLAILLLVFGAAFSPDNLFTSPEAQHDNTVTQQPFLDEPEEKVSTQKNFNPVAITGKAAYVWDIKAQRVLYKKNEAEQLPLASLTKLMTALLAHEILEEGDEITINQTAILQDGASGLVSGETFDRLSLSDLTLISSSNDGAFALAYAAGAILSETDPANAFVQAMNIRAKEIGLTETYFKNPTGLDLSLTEGGAYGTARDMAFLLEYILKNNPDILTRTTEEEVFITNQTGTVHDVENTNYYISEIPGLIGSKTGFTDLAGGNLAVAFNAGLDRPVAIVVLGSTRQDRFSDVIALVEETQRYISQQ